MLISIEIWQRYSETSTNTCWSLMFCYFLIKHSAHLTPLRWCGLWSHATFTLGQNSYENRLKQISHNCSDRLLVFKDHLVYRFKCYCWRICIVSVSVAVAELHQYIPLKCFRLSFWLSLWSVSQALSPVHRRQWRVRLHTALRTIITNAVSCI